jgi:hypothetical protein
MNACGLTTTSDSIGPFTIPAEGAVVGIAAAGAGSDDDGTDVVAEGGGVSELTASDAGGFKTTVPAVACGLITPSCGWFSASACEITTAAPCGDTVVI